MHEDIMRLPHAISLATLVLLSSMEGHWHDSPVLGLLSPSRTVMYALSASFLSSSLCSHCIRHGET